MRAARTLGSLPLILGLLVACGEKQAPEPPRPPAPVALTALATPEATLTRSARERGYVTRDPLATLAGASAVVWRHGSLVIRPLTGTVVAIAEDLRLPLGTAELGLARTLLHTPGAALVAARKTPPQVWDEHFGLGPASPRCAAGAACDAEGRVVRWHEDGYLFSVAWEGAHPRSIATGGRVFVELSYDQAGLTGLRAARLGTTAPPEAWPWHVTYARDGAGRIERVDAGGEPTRYRYDGDGRLVEIARGKAMTRLTYDAEHRVTAIEGPGALATRLTYASAAGLRADITVTDALGGATRFTWSSPSDSGTSEVQATPSQHPERALRWVFDGAGRLLAHTAAGARTQFVHDGEGRLAEVRHPDGLVQKLERGPDGRLAALVEGARRVAFTLTAGGDIAAIVAHEEDRETWTWSTSPEDAPRLARIEHASGRFERFTHDAIGRLVRVDDSDGAVDEVRYDEGTGLVATSRDERGAELTYSYDTLGRLSAVTRPDGSSERWTWDAEGRVASYTPPEGDPSSFEYDELDRPVRVSRAAGTSTWTYDALGRPLDETTPLGTTRYTWQGSDLARITLPDGRAVTHEVDAYGRLVSERTSDGYRRELVWASPAEGGLLQREREVGTLERRFTWDALGRLTRLEELSPTPGATRDVRVTHENDGGFAMKDVISGSSWTYGRTNRGAALLSTASTPTGAAEAYAYDARGRLVEKTSSQGLGFVLAYDALGRLVTSTSPAGGALRLDWTPGGRLASLEGDGDLARRFEYDRAGRLTAAAEGSSRWRFAYGTGPDPIEIIDPAGRSTTFTYDSHHRLISRTAPSIGTVRYAFDGEGRLLSEQRADGALHTFSWDELGRLLRHDVGGAPMRALTWDGVGRLVADQSPGASRRIAFDDVARARVTADDTRMITTTRVRDTLGRTERFEVDGRAHTRYLRRADGRLVRVEAISGFAVELDHDAFGRRTGLRFPGGGALRYRYDGARRLTGLDVVAKDGSTWSTVFSHDRAGRIASQSVAGRTLGYSYDDRGRLVALTLPDGTRREYRWNDAGDLLRLGDVEIPHDDAGRAIVGGRTWDAQGRLMTRPGGQSLSYDAAGRLVGVTQGATAIAYSYDGGGRLLGRSENGASTAQLVWDGDDLLELRAPAGTMELVPGELAGERLGFVQDGTPRYLVQGPDGTTLAVVDGEGQVLMTYLHEPFGTTLVHEGRAPDPFHYRGLFADAGTGLVHYPMRWYDPAVGTFIAPDPDAGDGMDPATLHRYAYLRADPVNHVDPLGAQAHEWSLGQMNLGQVRELFAKDLIRAFQGSGKALEGFSYAGSIDKRAWAYDIWIKRIPGSDKVLTIFRDLGQRAEGLGQRNTPFGDIVLDPDGPPRGTNSLLGTRAPVSAGPTVSATPATNQPGFISRFGAAIRAGVDQVKIGAQLYGKELTGTVGTLGGLSGTLGTGLGTLAGLPGGGLIIAAGAALAGALGYGAGTLIDKIPGVSQGAQILISKVLGYDKDKLLADLKAQMENEGAKAREHRQKTIADNLAKDTMPPPPEPGVAGGPANIGEPRPRDRDRPHVDPDAEAADADGSDDDDDDDDDDADDDDAATPESDAEPEILKHVAARKITVRFTHEEDVSAGEFKNVVSCDSVLTFWNVGSMAPGYGGATVKSVCVASLNGARGEETVSGSFSGGPNGSFGFAGDGGFSLRGGSVVSIPGVGDRPLPAGAFVDWPKDR